MTGGCEMDWEMPGDMPSAKKNYWGYQCCTEYGFYQTCEAGTECFYTQGLVSFKNTHHQPDDYCQSQFGMTRRESESRITSRDKRYSQLIANATRIIWVNVSAASRPLERWTTERWTSVPVEEPARARPVLDCRR